MNSHTWKERQTRLQTWFLQPNMNELLAKYNSSALENMDGVVGAE